MTPHKDYLTQHAADASNLTVSDYRIIQLFLSKSCGIDLGEDKHYLIKSRLTTLLGKFDISSLSELALLLQSNSTAGSKLRVAVINAMTTNETFWFRDEKQFSILKKIILPDFFVRKTSPLKIWSAACSSGQEPYSISIMALEALQAANKIKTVQIIGTDISEAILAEAKNAVYSELALSRGIDAANKARYFEKSYDGYKLKAEVSNMVRFQQFNLLKPFAALGRFDIIFCRNVLIYFSNPIKLDILNRMADSLEPGGCLFLSSTESMPSGVLGFNAVRADQTCYYQKAL